MLKVTCNLSSSYHPQTDGQAEQTNKTLEQYLRSFLSYQQDDWADILDFAEFAYNNSIHASTKVTPFMLILVVTPGGVYLKPLSCPQILVLKIV